MSEEHNTRPTPDQHDDDNPIGEMELPGRMTFGARVTALAGSTVAIGVVAVVGAAASATWTPTTPTTKLL